MKKMLLCLVNPLSCFNLYMNVSGNDMNSAETNYKFVLSLNSIFYNYFVPTFLFLLSSCLYIFVIRKLLKNNGSLIINYIFSSIFMWVLMMLVGTVRQSIS